MKFDVVAISEEDIKKLTAAQTQLLRRAQKSKNELMHEMEKELEHFKKLVYTYDMKESSIFAQKEAELQAEYEYRLDIIVEECRYGMERTDASLPDPPDADKTEYTVDYGLPYTDRYNIVRDYYMAIPDPDERLTRYMNDEVAKDYLGTYYGALLNVLYSYTK